MPRCVTLNPMGAAIRRRFVKQFVTKLVFGSALLACVAMAAPASAQEASKVDVGVGYQWLHAPDQSYPFGLNFDASGALVNDFRWVGEVSWSRDSESEGALDATLTAVSYGAGVRWAPAVAAYQPYAQVILGAHRDSLDVLDFSETNFMLQPGVGVTVPVGSKWGVFGQVDWRRVFYEDDGTNDFRLVVGARFNLK
jgi:hypothetical protein